MQILEAQNIDQQANSNLLVLFYNNETCRIELDFSSIFFGLRGFACTALVPDQDMQIFVLLASSIFWASGDLHVLSWYQHRTCRMQIPGGRNIEKQQNTRVLVW